MRATADTIKTISWKGSQPGCGNSLPCPFCLNPDSIEHTLIHCQESKEFPSKTLRWFNEYHKENIQLSNKQMLFNTFDDSLPLQVLISTQCKLYPLVLLQKKCLYTCKIIVTKPNLEEFYVSFLNNIALKIVANNIEYVWQLTGFFYYYYYHLYSNTLYIYCNSFCYLLTYLFTYLFIYFLLCINVVNLLSIKNK